MNTFEVIFFNKPNEYIEGYKVFKENKHYVVADEYGNVYTQYHKSEVECIAKVKS